ncbi:MAG: hypothetical protein ACREH6_11345 [Geminicoccaceae bacterium]
MRANHSGAFDTRRLRGLPIDKALGTPIEPRGRPGLFEPPEIRTYAALTFGDLLYDWIRIDPQVVDALDFVHVADLGDIFSFAQYADSLQGLGEAARLGNVTQLQGYVAERMVAGMLRAQGAEVAFPDSPDQPGYDLIVNGEHFQIKCLNDPGGVYEHICRYPHIPALVNEELEKYFPDDDRVMALPGLTHAEVHQVTESSLQAGADLLDLQIPFFSLTLQAACNSIAIARGHTDWRTSVENIGIDSLGRMAFSKASAVAAGVTVGLIGITGGWVAVVAPMLGAVSGYAGGKRITDALKRHVFCRTEADELAAALAGYIAAAINVLRAMIVRADEQSRRFGATSAASSPAGLVLIQDWQQRIKEENSFRMAMVRKFESCASPLDHGWRIGLDLIALHVEVCLNAARAGLLPANLARETRRLTKTSSAYRAALRKRLIAA